MKKNVFLIMLIFTFSTISINLFAKCYTFSNGGDYQVCVPGDSFSDRKKAQEICKKAKGSDCGSVRSYSSSCHSNSGKCYNQNGNASRDLKGY